MTMVSGNPELTDLSKLAFIWEIVNFDDETGIMEIQVNYTEAIWISAS
jgi:hypothetical protein